MESMSRWHKFAPMTDNSRETKSKRAQRKREHYKATPNPDYDLPPKDHNTTQKEQPPEVPHAWPPHKYLKYYGSWSAAMRELARAHPDLSPKQISRVLDKTYQHCYNVIMRANLLSRQRNTEESDV